MVEQDLIVTPGNDPRDPAQPPIHEAFASAAEIQPGVQMALVGGIGSGKTTELLLTLERLKRYPDAVNLLIEAAEFTDFSQTNPGAMLTAIGLRLFARYREIFGEPPDEIAAAKRGSANWVWGRPNGTATATLESYRTTMELEWTSRAL